MSDKIHFQNIFVPGMQVANNRVPLPLANGNFWRAGSVQTYVDFLIGGKAGYWWYFSGTATIFKPPYFSGFPLDTFFHVLDGGAGYIVVDKVYERIHKYVIGEEAIETVSFSDGFISNSVPPNKNLPVKYLEANDDVIEYDAITQVEGKTLIDTDPYVYFRLISSTGYYDLWPRLYHTDTGNNLSLEIESEGDITSIESVDDVDIILLHQRSEYVPEHERTDYWFYPADTWYEFKGVMDYATRALPESSFDFIFLAPTAVSRYTDYGGDGVYRIDVRFWLMPLDTTTLYGLNWGDSSGWYTFTWRESTDFPGYLYLEPFVATTTFSYGPAYEGVIWDDGTEEMDVYSGSFDVTIHAGGVPTTEDDLATCGRVGNLRDDSTSCSHNPCSGGLQVVHSADWRPVVFVPLTRLWTDMITWDGLYDRNARLMVEFDMESARVEFETQSYDMSESSSSGGGTNNLVNVDEDLSSSIDIAGTLTADVPQTFSPYSEEDDTGMHTCIKESVYLTGFTKTHPVIPSPTDADVIEHYSAFGVNTGDAPHSNYAFFGVEEEPVYKSRDDIELDFMTIASSAEYAIKDDTGTFYFFDSPTSATDQITLYRAYSFDPDGEESKSNQMESLDWRYHGIFQKDGSVFGWIACRSSEAPTGAYLEFHKYHGEDEMETKIIQCPDGMGAMTFFAIDNSLVHLDGNNFVHPRTNTKFNLATGESEMFVSTLPEGVQPHTFRGIGVAANKNGLHYQATKTDTIGENLFEGEGVNTAYPFTSFDIESNPPGFYLQTASGFTLLHPFEFEPGAAYYVSFESMPPTAEIDLYGAEVRFVYQSGWVVSRGMSPIEGHCSMGVASYDDEPEETVHAVVLCGRYGNAKIDLSTLVCKKSTRTSAGSFFQLKDSLTCTRHTIEGEGEADFARIVNQNTGYYFTVE